MARIRTIKPEFPQSESVGSLSRDARLLYIQLWTIVDDAGRTRAASRMLASLLYPYDDDARSLIDGWLVELEQGKHVRRYEVDGSQYLEVVKWLEHQKIDKPSKSRLPEFVEGSRIVAKPREASATDLGPSTMDLGPNIPTVAKATRRDDEFEEFWKSYPRRDGANPKEPAAKLFSAAVKAGADARDIIGGARRCAVIESKHVGTPYIPQAVKWLRDKRWLDYPVLADQSAAVSGFYAAGDSEQLAAWDAHTLKTRGKGLPRDRNGGWRVSSEWPPGYQRQERVEAPPIPMLRAVQ